MSDVKSSWNDQVKVIIIIIIIIIKNESMSYASKNKNYIIFNDKNNYEARTLPGDFYHIQNILHSTGILNINTKFMRTRILYRYI